jgi:hypothetical protein
VLGRALDHEVPSGVPGALQLGPDAGLLSMAFSISRYMATDTKSNPDSIDSVSCLAAQALSCHS